MNWLQPASLPVFTDWSAQAEENVHADGVDTITLDEARNHFTNQTAIFLDARPEDAYSLGHIKGALNLPANDIDARYADVLAVIDPEAVIITYCDGKACRLSADLAKFMKSDGFDRVQVLVDGWSLWNKSGLPVEENEG